VRRCPLNSHGSAYALIAVVGIYERPSYALDMHAHTSFLLGSVRWNRYLEMLRSGGAVDLRTARNNRCLSTTRATRWSVHAWWQQVRRLLRSIAWTAAGAARAWRASRKPEKENRRGWRLEQSAAGEEKERRASAAESEAVLEMGGQP